MTLGKRFPTPIFLVLSIAVHATEPVSFAIAMVRQDGIALPFARYDGEKWSAMWIEPAKRLDPPADAAAIPAAWLGGLTALPEQWHLWLVDDREALALPFEERKPRTLNTTGLLRYEAHCQQGVGLRTDFDRAQAPRPDTHPVPKVGIALSDAGIRMRIPVTVDPKSAIGKTIAAKAIGPFNRAEDEIVARDRDTIPATAPKPADRNGTPLTWTKMVRLGAIQAPSRTYYLEGEKVYGSHVTTGQVWLQFDRSRVTADAEAESVDIDRKGAVFRTPLGVITLDEAAYWIFQSTLWESETYDVFEVTPGRPPRSVVTVAGGGC